MEAKHTKYIIEVTQVRSVTTSEIKQFLVKETPTEFERTETYARGEKMTAKEYENKSVDVTREDKQIIYRQEAADLDLVDVINAVNGVSK